MISIDDYFGAHALTSSPSAVTRENALTLLARVNALLAEVPLVEATEPRINSGWRPAWYNATVPGAAPKSRHITGEALDLADPEGALDDYLFENQELLKRHNLFMEHPAATKGWCHLQCVPPRSGRQVFYP